jgi:hypothetical protein
MDSRFDECNGNFYLSSGLYIEKMGWSDFFVGKDRFFYVGKERFFYVGKDRFFMWIFFMWGNGGIFWLRLFLDMRKWRFHAATVPLAGQLGVIGGNAGGGGGGGGNDGGGGDRRGGDRDFLRFLQQFLLFFLLRDV